MNDVLFPSVSLVPDSLLSSLSRPPGLDLTGLLDYSSPLTQLYSLFCYFTNLKTGLETQNVNSQNLGTDIIDTILIVGSCLFLGVIVMTALIVVLIRE